MGFSSSKFFVYDGNHRLLAWKEVIEILHAKDQYWVSENNIPKCVVFDTVGSCGNIFPHCTISTSNFLLISYCFLSSYLALCNLFNLTCQLYMSNQMVYAKTSLVIFFTVFGNIDRMTLTSSRPCLLWSRSNHASRN